MSNCLKPLQNIFLIFSASLLIVTFTSCVSAQTPEQVVRDLYAAHKAKNVASMSKVQLRKYFDTQLADKFWKVAHGEGGIDFDVLYNTQDDAGIKNFLVGKFTGSASSGSVLVTFTNSGRRQKLDFKMATRSGVWKITDINYGKDFALVQTLNEY
jgi:hypothetical protein